MGRCLRSMRWVLGLRMRTRSTRLRSSRTLPGQWYWRSAARASSVISTWGRPYCCAELLQEFFDEERDVFFAVAQRRDEEGDDVEAVEEVFAEVAAGDLFFEVFVGGGDDADVDVDGVAGSDGVEALFV